MSPVKPAFLSVVSSLSESPDPVTTRSVWLIPWMSAKTVASPPEPPDPPDPPDRHVSCVSSVSILFIIIYEAMVVMLFLPVDLLLGFTPPLPYISALFNQSQAVSPPLPSVWTSSLIALVRFITAVCRPFADISRLFSSPWWQFEGLAFDGFIPFVNRVLFNLACPFFSFMEVLCLPIFPSALCGCDVGRYGLKTSEASVSVLIKGSTKWCFVTSVFVAEFQIVNCALAAVSIRGFGSLKMSSNSQGFILLFSTIGVEFGGLLHTFSSLSVLVASIYHLFYRCLAIALAHPLAMLAPLSCFVNNCSMDGE